MAKIVALAQGATALNLALTGLHVEEFQDTKDAESRCTELLQDDLDVFILEERLSESFSERGRDRLVRHRGTPLVVYCPSFEDEESDVDAYLSSVIKPAVGFEIRLG